MTQTNKVQPKPEQPPVSNVLKKQQSTKEGRES